MPPISSSDLLDAWYRDAATFSFGGHRIVYRDTGPQPDRPAIVCIHGFPTASWDWHRVWDGLAVHGRVLAADMLGFGRSDKPSRHRYSLLEQADLHEALLGHLGIRAVHLVAHDYGDTVAQELLARYASRKLRREAGLRIQSVLLLNGGLFPEAIRPRPVQRLLNGPAGALVGRLMTERLFRRSFTAVFGPQTQPSPSELRAFWMLVTANGGLRVAHRLSRYQAERRWYRARWAGVLERPPVPVRFVAGAQDPVSGQAMIDRYRALVPDADVVVLSDIGHYPQVEAPAPVLSAWAAFVQAQPWGAQVFGTPQR